METKTNFSITEKNNKKKCNNRIREINQLIYNVQMSVGEAKDVEACKLRRLINPNTDSPDWQNQNNG